MALELGAILVPMVTPFGADGSVDEEAAVRLMHHLLDRGADGVVIAGTTGEAATLTDEEQLRLIGLAVQEIGNRGTVVAGVGSNDTRHAVHLTERASELGPHALLSVNPYYTRPSRRGIVRHYQEVDRATDRPIRLYNIPQPPSSDLPNDLLAHPPHLQPCFRPHQPNPHTLPTIARLQT